MANLLPILAALFFVSPGLIGTAILIQSARRPKSKATVIAFGFLGAFLMWVQILVFAWAVNFGSAFNGQADYTVTDVLELVFLFCLVVYFVVAFVRLNNRKKRR